MKEYAFEGETIKINERDFNKWKVMYPNLNLAAELEQLDCELDIRQREGKDTSGWFVECYKRLYTRNKRSSNQSARDISIEAKLGDRSWAEGVTIGNKSTRDMTLEEELGDRSWGRH